MSKGNKNLLKYIGILYLSVLTTYKIPHDSYSIAEYIIRPIKIGGGTLYLWGVAPLILFIVGFLGLTRLDRYKNRNKLIVFLFIVIFILPIMKLTLDVARTNYHWIMGDELESIEIEDSDLHISRINNEAFLQLNIQLKDFNKNENKFKIRLYYPKDIQEYIGKEHVDLEAYHFTYGERSSSSINETIDIDLDSRTLDKIEADYNWQDQDYKIEIYNENEEVMNIVRGDK
ncbi:hypothetical protein GOQ27_01410 [Clostridium sp. D2Q-11]|uniref:Uncharacterized protein n=1 Tax=Anaeromonas frigoriresistens TaxID=2683708 RepID=A0A942Z7C0_9FIRM|nr:hypothetical protein [Anaeromonas frigoriresistens]MBS4537098.1 hypothetical protein [Anaeromonas frigoriresistens]